MTVAIANAQSDNDSLFSTFETTTESSDADIPDSPGGGVADARGGDGTHMVGADVATIPQNATIPACIFAVACPLALMPASDVFIADTAADRLPDTGAPQDDSEK
jgi:hypothetical protein